MVNCLAYVHARPNATQVADIFYVGKGTVDRSKWFYKRNPHHQNIVNKYGKDNILVGSFECSSEDIAFELEKGLIKCLKRMGVKLTNMTDGGEGFTGARHSEESKAKISAAVKLRADEIATQNRLVHTGRKRSLETCAKIAKGNTGKSHNDATKTKLSVWRSGSRWLSLNGQAKQVHRDQIELYLQNGWKLGRVQQ